MWQYVCRSLVRVKLTTGGVKYDVHVHVHVSLYMYVFCILYSLVKCKRQYKEKTLTRRRYHWNQLDSDYVMEPDFLDDSEELPIQLHSAIRLQVIVLHVKHGIWDYWCELLIIAALLYTDDTWHDGGDM